MTTEHDAHTYTMENQFAQMKHAAIHPSGTLQRSWFESFDLGAADLELNLGPDVRRIEVYEVVYTASCLTADINGDHSGAMCRFEWLLHSDAGIVQIALNESMLSPTAPLDLANSPWKYKVQAITKDNSVFEDYKLLFDLPKFSSIRPSANDFERLVDPATATDFNPLKIFVGAAVSSLLGIDWRDDIEVTITRPERPTIVIPDAFALGLYPVS